ncbi:DUF625-domain-containing protein [Patellaria atrata CBS 101060]|uniref:DUF625-domain-containing protein n=1 Tax=Patellaria atrata CBS 101060 TaxID=1346257 RepID=A0A9P4VQQ4_9PEZI|nr:DUF625-domain-containing protein [Patellaria atrata CBS 101060]
MALVTPPSNERKRVKVYELKSNDWYDRGTGFCTGIIHNDEARIFVESEDEPIRVLLETRVAKENGYQKQQDTLIVWTERNTVDMALSFQESDGCGAIWDFITEVQQRMSGLTGQDDGLSDDVIDSLHPIILPPPELGNLQDIENVMRGANSTPAGRDALAKYAVEADYITKLVPLVEIAEDLESLSDLHRLCNIMKTLILLNDTSIIEFVVTDDVILGVVGALEYDPDFPSHKANHRQYLSDESRFKEVVKIDDPNIKKKIHNTYRLQYLKDVVLARILDDPTFSVLNSLIFFNQVDIVSHLQANANFLKELFGIVNSPTADTPRKRDSVLFIQQCCAVAKGLQAAARSQLYQNFINGGLFQVVTFALRHPDPAVRVAGTDILVSLIDHDALMLRTQIFKSISEKSKPLTDTLIDLLLVEVDLGVKSQLADAIKVLLDPIQNGQAVENLSRTNSEFLAKMRQNIQTTGQSDSIIQNFYDESAKKLFSPLKELEGRKDLTDLSVQEVSLYVHLVEVLSFFVRSHSFRSKFFVMSEGLASRVAQLMSSSEKYLKLSALKYFRICIGLHDDFHTQQIIQNKLFGPILDLVYETMPRDNLLNSACLELFEFIRRESNPPVVNHLVENYRDRLSGITYVDVFHSIIIKYEELKRVSSESPASTSKGNGATVSPHRAVVNGGRFQGLKDLEPDEESYFNGSDDEDDEAGIEVGGASPLKPVANGASPVRPLVSYTDDDEEEVEGMDVLSTTTNAPVTNQNQQHPAPASEHILPSQPAPSPDRLSEKRRRDEDDDDELGKLSSHPKRRTSASSQGSTSGGAVQQQPAHGHMLRRKKSISSGKDGGGKDGPEKGGKKIAISMPVKIGSGKEDGAE